MPYICGYVQEIMKVTGKLSPGVTEPGTQTLNGVQATAYARIRYTAGDDFRRAEKMCIRDRERSACYAGRKVYKKNKH